MAEHAPEAIGLRNRLRAQWRGMPFEQRVGASIALTVVLAGLLFFVDNALGYAVLTISAR